MRISFCKDVGKRKCEESPTSRPAIEYQAETSQSLITEAVWDRLCCSSNVVPVSTAGSLSLAFPEGKERAAANGLAATVGSLGRSGAGPARLCLFWAGASLFGGGILDLKFANCMIMRRTFLYGQWEAMARCGRRLNRDLAAGSCWNFWILCCDPSRDTL